MEGDNADKGATSQIQRRSELDGLMRSSNVVQLYHGPLLLLLHTPPPDTERITSYNQDAATLHQTDARHPH